MHKQDAAKPVALFQGSHNILYLIHLIANTSPVNYRYTVIGTYVKYV